MVHVEERVTINRPIEEVFTYLSDLERQPEWVRNASEVRKTVGGPTKVGTTFHVVGKTLGRPMESDCEVTEYDPPSVYAWRGTSGPIRLEMRFTLTAEGPLTTRVTQAAEAEAGGAFRLARPILARGMKREFAVELGALKRHLESGVGTEVVTGRIPAEKDRHEPVS